MNPIIFVLIMLWEGTGSSNGVSTYSQEFYTEQQCLVAKAKFEQPNKDYWSQNRKAFCVQK